MGNFPPAIDAPLQDVPSFWTQLRHYLFNFSDDMLKPPEQIFSLWPSEETYAQGVEGRSKRYSGFGNYFQCVKQILIF